MIHHTKNCLDLDAASRTKSGVVCEECYNLLGEENGCGLYCWWLREHKASALTALRPSPVTLHCAFITAMMVHHELVVNMGGVPLLCGIVNNVGIFQSSELPEGYPDEHYLRTRGTVPIPRDIQTALKTDLCLTTARVKGETKSTFELLNFDTKLEEIRNNSRKLISEAHNFVVLSEDRVTTAAFQPQASVWEEVATEPSNSASPSAEE